MLQHSRMGHLNANAMKKMGFETVKKTFKCKTCIEGEFPKRNFKNQRDDSNVTAPFQEVYIDLSGKQSSPTFAGNYYFLGIIDYFSKFSWVYFLKTKDEAKTKLGNG